jgi:hypothetical protein
MDANELKQFPALPYSYLQRWHYLSFIRQEKLAHEVALKGYQEAESAATRRIHVYSLYEQGAFQKALEVIERAAGPKELSSRDVKLASGVYHYRPIVLAEMPDGFSRALEACRENCELYVKGCSPVWTQATVLLLGGREEAMAAGSRLYHPKGITGLSPHYQRILDYWGGSISAEDVLQAEAGSRCYQCETHFYIALERLTQRDRAGAREHFQKDMATRVFWYTEYRWSRSFLKRMDKDPNWPSWIPLKEPSKQPTTTP